MRMPWQKIEVERADPALSLGDWIGMFDAFNFQGLHYSLPPSRQEDVGASYTAMAQGALKGSVVVFAVMDVRAKLFSEARFQYQRLVKGRPSDLYGLPSLDILETPWPGATTGDLLYRMLQHADLAGNAFVARRAGKLAVLRPDWVTIIGGTNSDPESTTWDIDAEVLGYAYQEGGSQSGKDPVFFLAEEVAHFAPIPDPQARFRGMSWLSPIVREIMADKAATDHKLAFFENAATPNLVVKLDVPDLDKFKQWIQAFKASHQNRTNAYQTMFLGAGADATVVGADLKQMDFKITQGAGETRIAAAGGTPPIIVGLSEGLQSATYSNYGQARRRFADQTMRPLWRNVSGSLAQIIPTPTGSRLWYDDRDIAALQEDQKDAAEVTQFKSAAMKTLVDAGYTPESVVSAVDTGDLTQLKHSGLVSVQLQPPGTQTDATAPAVAD